MVRAVQLVIFFFLLEKMAFRNVSLVFARNILQWNLGKPISNVRGLKQSNKKYILLVFFRILWPFANLSTVIKSEMPDGSLVVGATYIPSSRTDKLV